MMLNQLRGTVTAAANATLLWALNKLPEPHQYYELEDDNWDDYYWDEDHDNHHTPPPQQHIIQEEDHITDLL
jgi:hypothetical protein